MKIGYLALANLLMRIGRAGLPLAKPTTIIVGQGITGIAVKTLINKIQDWIANGEDSPLLEFDVEFDMGENQDSLIIPVRLEWKREADEFFYAMLLMSGTMMYASFVRFQWGKFRSIALLRSQAQTAGFLGEVYANEESMKDIALLIEQSQESIRDAEAFYKSIDAFDDLDPNILDDFDGVWDVMQRKADELKNWSNLSEAQKATYADEVLKLRELKVAEAGRQVAKAKKIRSSVVGKVLTRGLGILDIGIFIGTGALALVLTDEQERTLLGAVFSDESIERYNWSLPMSISDWALTVGIINLIEFFGEDLEELGVPVNPETVLLAALSLMSDYWEIYIDIDMIQYTASDEYQTDFDINAVIIQTINNAVRKDPYLALEAVIGVITLKAIFSLYIAPFMGMGKSVVS